jgi:small GTP-binding protein
MIHLKLCMVGAFSVGKSSLVQRYVQSMFSEKYHTTVGVKIDKKDLAMGATPVRLVIWDLAGEDHFSALRPTFMRGAAGYLLVADGTRAHTLDAALDLNRQIEASQGPLPFALVLNKEDRLDEWEITAPRIESLERSGMKLFRGSAKSGAGVEAMFEHFASRSLKERAS